MKKTMMIAALFAASTFAACAADVYSSNVVGYTKLTIPAGYCLSGGQFQSVGGAALDLSAVVPEAGFVEGDALRFWTGAGYEEIGFYNDVYDPADDSLIGAGWGDLDQYIVTRPVDLGEGFWVQCFNGGTLTIAGEVGSTNIVTAPAGYTLVVNTTPASFDIADLVVTGFVEGDALRFWTGAGYEEIGFYNDVYDPADDSLIGPGFGDLDQYIVHKTVAVGGGFWVQCFNGGTVTFPDPTPAP